MEVDDFILSVQLDQMEEFIPSATETVRTCRIALLRLRPRRYCSCSFPTPLASSRRCWRSLQ